VEPAKRLKDGEFRFKTGQFMLEMGFLSDIQ
jgi:hypothetical protein